MDPSQYSKDSTNCPDGELTQEIVSSRLSDLGRSADGIHFVYLKCILSGLSLRNITCLKCFVHIQHLDLSKNQLEDLSDLRDLRYLVKLNVSHNKLSTILDLGGMVPVNLQEADFSFNNITEMNDLSQHKSLRKLFLDGNNIEEIKGISNLSSLRELRLNNNKIKHIKTGLQGPPIRYLYLNNNEITSLEGIDHVAGTLETLDVGFNRISSMAPLASLSVMQNLFISHNLIADIDDSLHLVKIIVLRTLNLEGNPVCNTENFRLETIYRLPQLTELNREKISPEEIVKCENAHGADLEQRKQIELAYFGDKIRSMSRLTPDAEVKQE